MPGSTQPSTCTNTNLTFDMWPQVLFSEAHVADGYFRHVTDGVA